MKVLLKWEGNSDGAQGYFVVRTDAWIYPEFEALPHEERPSAPTFTAERLGWFTRRDVPVKEGKGADKKPYLEVSGRGFWPHVLKVTLGWEGQEGYRPQASVIIVPWRSASLASVLLVLTFPLVMFAVSLWLERPPW